MSNSLKSWALVLFACLGWGKATNAQIDSFRVEIESRPWKGFPAVHSGAVAVHEGHWIYIGGRINGLHGFQQPFGFPNYGKNTSVYVMDPASQQIWSADLNSLPASLFDPLTSSNIPFYQDGQTLFMAGGYGWSNSANAYVTFPTLTAVDLECLHANVLSGGSLEGCFRQITDERMAICGAHLEKLNNQFMLVFGHRFDGVYSVLNPGGSIHTQSYSNAIRRFNIVYNDAEFGIQDYSEQIDTVNYHRRDYNLVPQVLPGGEEGFTAFSGVFQYGAFLPYLNTLNVTADTAVVNPGFDQHYSQYHNAVMPVYDATGDAMHTVFFGGMSRYYIDAQTQEMVDDTLVPFVKTISRVSRLTDGSMVEEVLPDTMPDYLGSNMDFIPDTSTPMYRPEIIDLNALPNGRTLVGYLMGGIRSPERNPGASDPTVTQANLEVFNVYIVRGTNDTGIVTPNLHVLPDLESFSAQPNPARGETHLKVALARSGKLELALYDRKGALVRSICNRDYPAGSHTIAVPLNDLARGNYLVRARINGHSKAISLVIHP